MSIRPGQAKAPYVGPIASDIEDHMVVVSATDATPGYLSDKLSAGDAIILTEDVSVPADHTTEIAVDLGTGATQAAAGNHTHALDDLSDVAAPSPSAGQVLKYDGMDWINGDLPSGGGAAAPSLYPDTTASAVPTYDSILTYAAGGAEEIDSVVIKDTDGETLISAFAGTALNRTSIGAGLWTLSIWRYVDDADGVSEIILRVYKRTSGGTETELFNATTGEINVTVNTQQTVSSVQAAFGSLNLTDLLVMKFFGKTTSTTNRTISFTHNGVTHISKLDTPMTILHNDLEGLQGGGAGDYYHVTAAEKLLIDSHDFGGAQHAADTIANVNTKLSDGDMITTLPAEISALTAKASPTTADFIMIEDAAAANAKKSITIANLPAAAPAAHDLAGALHNADTITNLNLKLSDGDVLSNKSAEFNAFTSKTTPVAADILAIEDSAATNAKKKIAFSDTMKMSAILEPGGTTTYVPFYYGTGSPPSASGKTDGTLWFKYTA